MRCVKEIARLPSVAIDPHITPTTEICDVHVPVAFVGVEVGGNCYRMDNVPIEARKVVEPPEGNDDRSAVPHCGSCESQGAQG